MCLQLGWFGRIQRLLNIVLTAKWSTYWIENTEVSVELCCFVLFFCCSKYVSRRCSLNSSFYIYAMRKLLFLFAFFIHDVLGIPFCYMSLNLFVLFIIIHLTFYPFTVSFLSQACTLLKLNRISRTVKFLLGLKPDLSMTLGQAIRTHTHIYIIKLIIKMTA